MLTWWLAFTHDVRRERTFTTQQIATLHDVYASPLAPLTPSRLLPRATLSPSRLPQHQIRYRTSPPPSEGDARCPRVGSSEVVITQYG
jgi:hypothetical protein